MSYRAVVVEQVQRRAGKYGTFLSCRLRAAGGEVLWAQCFDVGMFDPIDAACDADPKPVIRLELATANVTRADGTPFLNIVGREHPGQRDLFNGDRDSEECPGPGYIGFGGPASPEEP